jgi:hypothetical protein
VFHPAGRSRWSWPGPATLFHRYLTVPKSLDGDEAGQGVPRDAPRASERERCLRPFGRQRRWSLNCQGLKRIKKGAETIESEICAYRESSSNSPALTPRTKACHSSDV